MKWGVGQLRSCEKLTFTFRDVWIFFGEKEFRNKKDVSEQLGADLGIPAPQLQNQPTSETWAVVWTSSKAERNKIVSSLIL